MTTRTTRAPAEAIAPQAIPLTDAEADLDPLFEMIGDASLVLLGEASHGTHEFYRTRAQITRRLIRERGFVAVAVEADWPDAWRVNRYVRGLGTDEDATEALGSFSRFPQWMWRNADVLDFVGWLRQHDESVGPGERKAGFYGLDLYSLHASIQAVLAYLDAVDPEAARRARERYACFDHYQDPQEYGFRMRLELDASCESEVVEQLVEMRRAATLHRELSDPDAQFAAEQNARLVQHAEEYYRSMFRGRVESWNLRDRHMAETLEALRAHVARDGTRPKIVVWEHNSHLGDARATDMGRQGELNVGQLVRERHGRDAVLVGFTTHHGTVTAASDWGAPAERRRIRAALPESFETLFHEVGIARFLLRLRDDPEAADALAEPRLERAIGVVYRPETERASHYFRARLPRQFDAVIHVDETRAVEPLERTAAWDRGHPDTFPTGM